jgi:glycosyltransferase involved in cell wall biosynthesis
MTASLLTMPVVGVSALTLVPGVVGGSETAYRALLRAYHAIDDLDVRVFLPSIAADAAEGHAYSVIRSYPASRSTAGRLAAMATALAAGGRIRREMRLDRLDVLHFPFSTMIPPVEAVPTVTSILDVQHEAIPEFFSRAELAYRRRVYGSTARRSTAVIAISQHAADAIHEHLGVPRDRIRVIHLGVDTATFTPGTAPRSDFLLYPANWWPHKNHGRLFEALALLRRADPDLRLVLTGSGHPTGGFPPGVESLGRVSTERLVELYRTAAALVYPSLYEGFGMPVVEAMATGCPVACSNTSSLPEVAGDAAVLFDPTSPEAIAAGVRRVLDSPRPFTTRGLERAARFTWERSAAAHAALYRELAS